MFNYNLFIETKRLIIRPFTMGDLEASYEMNLDSLVSKYTGDGGVVSKQEIERRIREDVLGDYAKHGFGRLVVELKGVEKFIGFTGLKYLDDIDEVDLGYRFKSEYWGAGYATEAGRASLNFGFETLGLSRIIAMVLPNNINSKKVLNKLNFKFEKDILEQNEQIKVFSLYRNQYNL